jgi:two-component system, NarL family, sensor kinase
MQWTTRKSKTKGQRPLTVTQAVLRFTLGSLLAVAVVAIGGYFALRNIALDEAKKATENVVLQQAQVVETVLNDGIFRNDPRSLAALDDLVQGRILQDKNAISRVKIWSPEGKILYSDEPRLIGKTYTLDGGQKALLRTGGAEVEVSDLSRPENTFDRLEGQLLEAYTPVRTPTGRQAIFEIYQRFGSIDAAAQDLLRSIAPPLVAGLIVLLLIQTPLAWSMARGLQRGHTEREMLLANAIEASNIERRRIASHLHDGAVQEIAGTAFGLAPMADEAAARGDEETAAVLRRSIDGLRATVRDLRTLLVELHPANLEATGLEASLSDLASPLEAKGMTVELEVRDEENLSRDQKALMNRVAQEALRNVLAHSGARTARVEVSSPDGVGRLVVADDGKGFDEGARARRREEGHLGLSLLEELVAQSGGTLSVRSVPGEGTRVELEVPRTR